MYVYEGMLLWKYVRLPRVCYKFKQCVCIHAMYA